MKRLLLLSTVLIALVIIAWATGMFGEPASTVDLPDLALDGSDITSVDVTSGNEFVRAHRLDSGEWQLDEPVQAKADTATVMRLVRQVKDISLESIVSSNPERFGRFQVDTSGSRLTVTQGDRRLDLIVGKMGPDFQSRYVRLDGDDRVMLATGVPPLSVKIDQWRDKTLWLLPEEAITNVFVTSDAGSYSLSKTDRGWNITSGSEGIAPDSAEVTEFLSRLSSLKVDGFESNLTIDSVLVNVTHRLRIELANGTSETLLMSKRSRDVAALREGSVDVYKLFSYRLTNLTPNLEKLSAKATE